MDYDCFVFLCRAMRGPGVDLWQARGQALRPLLLLLHCRFWSGKRTVPAPRPYGSKGSGQRTVVKRDT